MNQDSLVRIQDARSQLADLDYATAITQLNQQMTGLDAAQKSFLQIQNLSLFKYL
jgi:flagellar hook-associated protein 3 FlgL